MERIKLGIITAPVGIKGEVRVFPYTDEITRFSAIKELFIEGTESTIQSVRYQGDMVVLKLAGIEDRNAAEAARNKTLYLDRAKLWKVPKDTYFNEDIIGMSVYTVEGRKLGVLAEVIQNSSQDIFRIEKEGGKSFMVPAVKEFIKKVDVASNRMEVQLIEGLEDL